jgi:predicted dehydrogenase
MIRVGIVGCGKVADQHAAQIRTIGDAKIVAACDSEPLMARQLAERFDVSDTFVDVDHMLRTAKPDVVHITTPPASHFALGKQCLEAGCHVYIEKPFTLYADEAEQLVALATQRSGKLTVGHNAQFTPAMLRMRELITGGYLGGNPIHLESVHCYTFGDDKYASALLGDGAHWVRQLPGSLLQNIISHGISKIAEFLQGENPEVQAMGFTSPFLRGIGQADIVDELRLMIRDETGATAYFTFSSQFRPAVHQFRLYGPKNSLLLDEDHQVVLKLDGGSCKSYVNYVVPPLVYAKQCVGNVARNVASFARGQFPLHYDAGMRALIARFYASISVGAALPIPYREIVLTAKIMDQIFAQIGANAAQRQAPEVKKAAAAGRAEAVL